jgi:hypothetical protein
MALNREKVLAIVIQALKDAQEDFPDETIEIGETTYPIGELKYFDSLTSVMVTVDCLSSLGCGDKLDFPTLFIDKKGNALTVGDVVDQILILLKK